MTDTTPKRLSAEELGACEVRLLRDDGSRDDEALCNIMSHIAALEAELADAREIDSVQASMLGPLRDERDTAIRERDRFKRDNDYNMDRRIACENGTEHARLRSRIGPLEQERDQARAEVQRLRGALQAIEGMGGVCHEDDDPGSCPHCAAYRALAEEP